MQFRESENRRRVQCLAAMYDNKSKRTRQKLVWTIDFYDVGRERPAPGQLSAGTIEQREQWAAEISRYVDGRDEMARESKIRNGIIAAQVLMDAIIDDLLQPKPIQTEEEMKRVRNLVLQWAKALNVIPEPTMEYKTPSGPRADWIKDARRFREEGKSVVWIVDHMAVSGRKVSRSWVFKWTSPPAKAI